MNRPKIAVLGANLLYLSCYRQARDLGYEIYSFGRGEDDHPCSELADHFYPLDFKRKEEILEICRNEGVNGVTSFVLEGALPYVYYISRGLGVPCNSKECEALTANKHTMREQLKKKGVSIPQYKAISSKDEQIDIPFPLIVKPSDNGGSRGVTLVRTPEELDLAIDRALSWSFKKEVMVEQFVEGREFSIESISYQGRHYVLQITDKVTTGAPYFVELEHHQPALLTPKQWDDIKNLTTDMLSALHVEYGASHTEIKMDNEGIPYVIEMGARMGGDCISDDLVRLSTGYDFVKGVCEVATGHFSEPTFPLRKSSGVYFLSKETEYVLPYIQQSQNYPEIVNTSLYGGLKNVQCNSDRGGFFIYQDDKRFVIKK